MSRALELVRAVEANGGRLSIEDESLVIDPRRAGEPVLAELRLHKAEIIDLLRSRPSAQTETPDPHGLGLFLLARTVADPRRATSLAALFRTFCVWRAEVDLPSPTQWALAQMLSEVGFATIGGLVQGLALEEDWTAHQERKQPMPAHSSMPAPMPAKRRERVQ